MKGKQSLQLLLNTPSKRNLLLFVLSILLLGAIYCIPVYRNWFSNTIIAYGNNFNYQKDRLDIEYRKTNRFGDYYTVTKSIEKILPASFSNKLLLVPSSEYFKEKGIVYDVPEPVVFYYFTNVKTVWSKSKEAYKANAVVLVNDNKQLVIDTVLPPTKMDSLIKALNKYSYPL